MTTRAFIVLLLVLAASSARPQGTTAADSASPPRVNVVVQEFDVIDRAWGMRADEFRDAAVRAAESEGWSVEASGPYTISVLITPVGERTGDLYPFTVEVTGGPTEKQGPDWDKARLNARQIVDTPWNDHRPLIDAVRDMVRDLAFKLKARSR